MQTIDMLRDFAQLFSRGEAQKWINCDYTSINTKLERYNLLNKFDGKNYSTTLYNIYQTLVKNYPNEYIVKNEYINNNLIKEIKKSGAVLYNEFRLGKAIADLALFNGVSHAYEIKTELDTKIRLDKQIIEYKKIFNKTTIIVPAEELKIYESYDSDIGIITYDSHKRNFQSIRDAQYNININIDTLMQILHSKEYLKIIEDHFGEIKGMNAFNQFNTAKELLSTLSQERLNTIFIQTIKQRSINNSFLKRKYSIFNQLSLALNLKEEETEKIIESTTINTL